uniref:Uncharacterized protein n=1 Tax=Arundo donax TaxID=35708 RepID=A0A0A8ZDM2_ARUDO
MAVRKNPVWRRRPSRRRWRRRPAMSLRRLREMAASLRRLTDMKMGSWELTSGAIHKMLTKSSWMTATTSMELNQW